MTIIARSSLAANLADVFASRTEILGGMPVLAWEDDADNLSWLDDSMDEPYEPSEDDLAEYAAWSRSLDGGCPVDALTIEEMDLLAHSVPDRQFREMLEDEVAEHDARLWS